MFWLVCYRGLVGNKSLSRVGMQPVLEKLLDHLITKNVASDIAAKLCDSVAAKLEGKVSYNSFVSLGLATWCWDVYLQFILLVHFVYHFIYEYILSGTID